VHMFWSSRFSAFFDEIEVSVLTSLCVFPLRWVDLYFILYFRLYCIHLYYVLVYVWGWVPWTVCVL